MVYRITAPPPATATSLTNDLMKVLRSASATLAQNCLQVPSVSLDRLKVYQFFLPPPGTLFHFLSGSLELFLPLPQRLDQGCQVL
jgi:hypothetical protein